MGLISNSMGPKTQSLFLLLLFLIPISLQQEQGFVSVVMSKKGLDFAKDLIMERAISSMVPLKLPRIEKTVRVPVLGSVDIVLSNITINSVDVSSSFVESGETGVVLVASGATAKLGMDWSYYYSSWFVEVSDDGSASIEVQGMDVGMTLALDNQDGTLKLSVLESGCYVRSLVIKMNGGASWLYQGLIDAFKDLIESQVEEAVSKKITEGISKLDSLLQTLPKQIPVYNNVAMNVTFVGNPVLSNTSIELDINGLFVPTSDSDSSFCDKELVDLFAPNNSTKMVKISLHEKVFNSISSVFFNAGYLQWFVDKITDQSLLNTSRWKYIIPRLYRQYPDEAMSLNVSISSPPTIQVLHDDIAVTIYSDVIINVLDFGEIVPVLCISLEISASGSPKMVGNNLVGTLELRDFDMFLEWSKVGNIHMRLVESVMSIVLKRFVFPYANVYLWKGLPLPILRGFTLQNAQISCSNSKLEIGSDVAFVEQWQSVSRQFVSAKLL